MIPDTSRLFRPYLVSLFLALLYLRPFLLQLVFLVFWLLCSSIFSLPTTAIVHCNLYFALISCIYMHGAEYKFHYLLSTLTSNSCLQYTQSLIHIRLQPTYLLVSNRRNESAHLQTSKSGIGYSGRVGLRRQGKVLVSPEARVRISRVSLTPAIPFTNINYQFFFFFCTHWSCSLVCYWISYVMIILLIS